MTDKMKVCKDCNEPDCDGDDRDFCGECGGMMIVKKEHYTQYEKDSYAWRRFSESKSPGYCGSCSIETHAKQIRDPKSWVSEQTVNRWMRDWEKKLQAEKMESLKIPSNLNKCQLMILALTASLEEQTAINTLLEGEIKQTAIGERAAHQEVDRLLHELRVIDNHWRRRFREQADQWEDRTKLIRKQLDKMVEMVAQNKLFQPPSPIIVKCGKSEVFEDKPPMISVGCTWPVGDCECMDGDQEEI